MRYNNFERKRNSEFILMYKWVSNLLDGEKFLNIQNKKIVIYGVGDLADLLVKQLVMQGREIEFFIDRNAVKIKENNNIDICTLKQAEPRSSHEYQVIVTIVNQKNDIKKCLAHTNCEVISIEEVVFG